MSFFKLHKYTNFNFLNIILISFFFLLAIYIIRYHYDGHHIGLMYSNALDLINGKSPYKDIFIQYGFLTTLIHAFLLTLFDNKVIILSIFTAIFYSFSILFISLAIKNITNSFYAFITTLLVLFNHPIPWLPWSNYTAFFFLSLSIYLLTKKNINYYLLGFIFGLVVLSRQEFFIPLFSSILIFLCYYFLKYKKISYKLGINLFFGFLSPVIIFLIYLFYNDIFFYWVKFLILPNLYLEVYQTSLLDLITNFIYFFLTDAFFNFIITPQYFLISLILIANTILIILEILNKINIPKNIFYLSVLSCFLCSLGLKIEMFRLYTSVIVGLIPLLFSLYKLKDKILKRNLIKLLLLPSIFSIIFYPYGNNPSFDKIHFKINNLKIENEKFKFYNWPESKIKSINLIDEISKKCDVDYLDNLTFDTMYSTVGNFDRVRMIPSVKNSMKDSNLDFYFESIKNPEIKFYDKINTEIMKENIILLIDENNNVFKGNRILFTNNYDHLKIDQSNVLGKPNMLNIYYPKKCLNKS